MTHLGHKLGVDIGIQKGALDIQHHGLDGLVVQAGLRVELGNRGRQLTAEVREHHLCLWEGAGHERRHAQWSAVVRRAGAEARALPRLPH